MRQWDITATKEMKKTFILLMMALMISSLAFAQDIIVTIDAQKIEAKILEVSKSEIKYKEKGNLNGPTFVLGTEEINSVIYSNGKVVLYNQPADTEKSEETTQQSTPVAEEYNIEIMLRSGEIIKGKRVELNENYIVYISNDKYQTVQVSDIAKVTNLRNGIVTNYNMDPIPSSTTPTANTSSVQTTSSTSKVETPATKSRIYRDNGHYLYNDIYISSKEVERILERENSAAYAKWKKGNGLIIGGSICTVIGGGLVIGGIVCLVKREYNACIGLNCAALAPLGIGIGLTYGASSQYNKAIDLYNSKIDHSQLQLRWGFTSNGIGVALSF